MYTLSAVYWCYKNKNATEKVLKAFRSSYPMNMVLLISDCGDDVSELAERYACTYVYCKENLKVGTGSHDVELGLRGILQHLEYIKTYITTTHCLVLEDDVIVLKPYNLDRCIDAINGELINQFGVPQLGITPRFYSGHGGSIYNVQQLMEVYDNKLAVSQLIDYHRKYMRLVAGDLFLSMLIALNGRTVGSLPGSYSYKHDRDLEHDIAKWLSSDSPPSGKINEYITRGICTLHPFKLFYSR